MKSFESTEKYIRRIEALKDSVQDHNQLVDALKTQSWAIRALIEENISPSVRSLGQKVLDDLNKSDVLGENVVESLESLIKVWNEERLKARNPVKETINIAWLTSLVSIISTVVALFIGNVGILTWVQGNRNVQVGTPLTDLEFIDTLEYLLDNKTLKGDSINKFLALNKKVLDDSIANLNDSILVYNQKIKSIESETYQKEKKFPKNNQLSLLSLIHVLILALLLILMATIFRNFPYRLDSIEPHIKKTLNQLVFGWSGVLISWLLLYIVFHLAYSSTIKEIDSYIVWIFADAFNMINAGCFLYMFLVLDMPTVSTKDNPKRDSTFRTYLGIIIGLLLCILVLSISGRLELFNLTKGGPIILSIVVAVSMAYFFGRLDSHHMKVNRLALAPLYFYVAIQLIWPSFNDPDTAVIFFTLALILKIYLFMLMYFWLQNRSFSSYIKDIGPLFEKQDLK